MPSCRVLGAARARRARRARERRRPGSGNARIGLAGPPRAGGGGQGGGSAARVRMHELEHEAGRAYA